MTSESEFPDLQWTRETLIKLAEAIETRSMHGFADDALTQTLRSASVALRFSATLTVQDECRQRAPYKPMYRIRKANAEIIWTCAHVPPHESPA